MMFSKLSKGFHLSLVFILFLFSCADHEPLKDRDQYFKKKFNDVQAQHLPTAKKLGIPAQATRSAIEKHSALVNVKKGKGYKIAHLTHSSAKVLPKTKKLIQDIGKHFSDSLKSKNLSNESFVVTSLTRSKQDQKNLSKSNRNAARQSAHFHGTTFDISYIRFNRNKNAKRDVLAQILENLRKQKRCWVKYEINQRCFHITVRH